MNISLSSKPSHSTRIVFLTKENAKIIRDFEGDAGKTTVRSDEKTTTIYCGCGEEKKCTPAVIRSAGASGIAKAMHLKRAAVSLMMPDLCGKAGESAALEGAILGSYQFDKYKSEKKPALEKIECVGSSLTASQTHDIETACSAALYARDLTNENASVMTPARLALEARALGRTGKLKITVLDEKTIDKKGLGLIKAVGQGSATPPRLIFIEYLGDKSSKKKTAIIGKGITFDSGGQNLKPTGHIETMRMDMAGAAAVLGTMKALAALKPKVNVIGCVAAAHNAIGQNAFFPGDIHPSYAGKTVEILSTDAEGRLVLADAVAYTVKNYRPARIIDLATLTGGILIALGDLVAGLFSNNDTLAKDLFASGEKTGERLWQFPLYQEYRDSLKGDLSDLRNLSKMKKGYASSITGAAFIQEFVGSTPWAHLDIAGTAWNEGSARGEIPQFATGFGVRLLVNFLAHGAF
ncbi:MAG: leucyl aminopeptidase family protein [Chitinispirillaceae bacterium]|nr:leucyl aminopeptidase family protein [Chitinispirillaceae bacterium]